jgi:hypothetical protein
MSLSLSAFVHDAGSTAPAESATLHADCTIPGGHLGHFCARSAQGPLRGVVSAGATATAGATAAVVDVATTGAAGDDGNEAALSAALLHGPATIAETRTSKSFMMESLQDW